MGRAASRSASQQCWLDSERSGAEFMRKLLPHAERLGRAFPYTGERYRAP